MVNLAPNFLSGVTRFVDNVEGEDRLVIPISLAGRGEEIWTIVDTAATFSVIAPNIVQDLGLQPTEYDDEKVLMTRWGRITGNLCRIKTRIDTLTIEGAEDVGGRQSIYRTSTSDKRYCISFPCRPTTS